DNIYDVLCYYCDQLVIEIDDQYEIFLKTDRDDIYKFVLSFWAENNEFLESLYISHLWDILQTSMETKAKNLRANLTKNFISAQDADYFFSIFSGVLSGILRTWIRHGKKEEISTMDEKIQDILKVFIK
ncbi:MAG: TetR-like C-terminal domain-containing protein, partial [Lachnospirales bacterium]